MSNKILVVANETLVGRALTDQLRSLAEEPGSEVHVVVPALTGRMKYFLSDIDGPRAEALQRLQDSLASLRDGGIQATGAVGDSNPVRAFEDALALFDPDQVLISTHPPGRSNWLEKGVVEEIGKHTDLPISHVVVDVVAELHAASY